MQVWYAVRRLSLGVTLIVMASAVLLVSDRGRRTAALLSDPSPAPGPGADVLVAQIEDRPQSCLEGAFASSRGAHVRVKLLS